jgi:hypothetical protein
MDDGINVSLAAKKLVLTVEKISTALISNIFSATGSQFCLAGNIQLSTS